MDVTYFKTDEIVLKVCNQRTIRIEVANPMTGVDAATELSLRETCVLAEALAKAAMAVFKEVIDDDVG